MATIGTFTAQGDGYTGSIKTLTLNVKAAVLRPNEKSDDKAPDFRIFSGQTEFGAAWKKTSRENRDYLSVKLDDPSFPAPIYASLVEVDTLQERRDNFTKLGEHEVCVGPSFGQRMGPHAKQQHFVALTGAIDADIRQR
jgi:uncharacterized protein (DUF736 family)